VIANPALARLSISLLDYPFVRWPRSPNVQRVTAQANRLPVPAPPGGAEHGERRVGEGRGSCEAVARRGARLMLSVS